MFRTTPLVCLGHNNQDIYIQDTDYLPSSDLEYSSLVWGAESLTLLCPKDEGEEPYVTIPELVQKVLHHRSYVNMQQRNRLGVAVHPATSLQIHALRARGTLDSSAG